MRLSVGLLALCAGLSGVLGAQTWDEPNLIAKPGSVSGAKITTVTPITTQPGVLMSVEGKGFGTTPVEVLVGTQKITRFVSWEDTCIFFRLPGSVKQGDLVRVGNAVANAEKFSLRPAPAGSLWVQWVVDVSKVTPVNVPKDKKAQIRAGTAFTSPLFIKGEWYRSGRDPGMRDELWDGGLLSRMCHPSGNIWIAEFVFTPDNVKSFGSPANPAKLRAAKFSFEDGNLARNLGQWESDWVYFLKRDLAVTDLATSTHTDPAFYMDTNSPLYNAADKKLVVVYPVKK